MASSFTKFLDHTRRRVTLGRIPLEARSARRRDLYLATHNTQNRETSMPPPRRVILTTISTGEWPQTYALTARLLGPEYIHLFIYIFFSPSPSIILYRGAA